MKKNRLRVIFITILLDIKAKRRQTNSRTLFDFKRQYGVSNQRIIMLSLKSVTKDYVVSNMTVNALRGVDLCFRRREFAAILGPSGCGKTTLLNIVGGLDRYSDGDLLIDGKSTKDFTSRDWDTYRSRKIGFVFQSYNLIPHLSVLSNVELALTISGISKKEKKERAICALEKVGLKEQIHKKPSQLSGGQMQRVAIARAVVNNPDIILADEPTGALDSVTSVQVLDILKELSNDCLVIMVTHNGELAAKYSTRIIKLFDGRVTSDTNPFKEENEERENLKKVDLIQSENASDFCREKFSEIAHPQVDGDNLNDKVPNGALKTKKKRSSMSLFTAISLSARNLIVKKFRTILTTFAGSVGIIGIALVLSISNGFNLFMKDLESTTLSSFPITVDSISFNFTTDFSSPFINGEEGTFPSEPKVSPSVPQNQFGMISFHPNFITESYIEYVKQMKREHPDWVASVSFKRTIKMHLLSETKTDGNSKYSLVDTTSLNATWWQELLDTSFLENEYDVLSGRFPTAFNELVLIVDANNRVPLATLGELGYRAQKVGEEYLPFDFSEFVGNETKNPKSFKLLYNNDYYKPNGINGDGVNMFKELSAGEYAAAYSNAATELKIVGILRLKRDADLRILKPGIGYVPALTEHVLSNSLNSEIVKSQKQTFVDVLSNGIEKFEYDFTAIDTYIAQTKMNITGLLDLYKSEISVESYNNLRASGFTFKDLYDAIAEYDAVKGDEMLPIDKLLLPLELLEFNTGMLKSFLNADYIERLKEIGADTVPNSISIYPANFDNKANILNYLDNYNTLIESEMDKIKYNDIASTVSKSVSEMVDITSYVLIAFAAISLLVSSIMIGIVTYISVLERTKEIGVLRSLGARKLDVSNLFNAETIIIGLASGILGVILAAILNFPVNSIITNYTGPMVQNLARLNVWHGILLVILSTLLNLIAGIIPATIAARKDPVAALRE